MKNIFIVLFLFISFTFSAYAVAPEVGDIPPNYVGRGPDNEPIDLEAFKGKVVILSFWASWCAPCRKELPILDEIQRKVGGEHLKVIAINHGEERRYYKKVLKLLKDAEITFSYDRRLTVSKRFGVESLPNMFIINREGKIAFHHLGYGEGALPKLIDDINSVLLEGQ